MATKSEANTIAVNSTRFIVTIVGATMPPGTATGFHLNSTYLVFDNFTYAVAQKDKRVDMPTAKVVAEMQDQARRAYFQFKAMRRPADQFRCFYSLTYKHKY